MGLHEEHEESAYTEYNIEEECNEIEDISHRKQIRRRLEERLERKRLKDEFQDDFDEFSADFDWDEIEK